MARNALKLFIIVGENFEINLSQVAENALKLYAMVGENFRNYLWLTVNLNYPPWLDKIFEISFGRNTFK